MQLTQLIQSSQPTNYHVNCLNHAPQPPTRGAICELLGAIMMHSSSRRMARTMSCMAERPQSVKKSEACPSLRRVADITCAQPWIQPYIPH